MDYSKILEKQELIKDIARTLWNKFGLDTGIGAEIAETLVDKYAIKSKKAYTATYIVSKTIYADDYDEAVEIFDNLSIDDMVNEGEWELEEE